MLDEQLWPCCCRWSFTSQGALHSQQFITPRYLYPKLWDLQCVTWRFWKKNYDLRPTANEGTRIARSRQSLGLEQNMIDLDVVMNSGEESLSCTAVTPVGWNLANEWQLIFSPIGSIRIPQATRLSLDGSVLLRSHDCAKESAWENSISDCKVSQSECFWKHGIGMYWESANTVCQHGNAMHTIVDWLIDQLIDEFCKVEDCFFVYIS